MFWQRLEKFELVIIGVLALAYLGAMAALALTQDRQFFLNDLLAIVIWLVIGLLLFVSRTPARRH